MNLNIACLVAILTYLNAIECSPTTTASDVSILTHDRIGHNVSSFDFCSRENICAQYPFSVCVTSNRTGNIGFECLCDPELFDIASVKIVNFNKTELRMQSCKVKNLCSLPEYACADKDAKCHFTVEYDSAKGEYTPYSFCTCPATNQTLPSRELRCKQMCNAVCGNSMECAQDYLTNKVVCHCKDGWTGAACDTKIELHQL